MPKVRSHGDGGLYKIRGGALYRATYTYGTNPETGKPLVWSATSRTKAGAREKLDEAKEDIAKYGVPLDKTATLAMWAPRWLEMRKPHIDPKTWAGYASISRRHIIPALGDKRIAALKPSDVVAMRKAIADKGRASSTARQAHIVLSMMLESARVDRLCRTNVAEDAPIPGSRRKKVVAAKRGAFTTEQIVALLATAAKMDPSLGSRWWFKIMTAARQGEVLGAPLDDLHLDDAYYVVNWKLEELVREHGCDGDCGYKQGARCPQALWRVPDDFEKTQIDGRWHLTRPKSITGRAVPLIPQMVEALRRHLDITAGQPNPHGLIWHDGTGRPIQPKDDTAQWRDLLVRAKIITPDQAIPGGPMTGHWARHTAVTVLMELTGGDSQLVGEIVGHSSAEVTEIYRHARASERTAAMSALGAAWTSKLPQIAN